MWVQIASAREQLFEGRALERRAHLLRVLQGLALRLRHRARAEGVGRLDDLRVGVHLVRVRVRVMVRVRVRVRVRVSVRVRVRAR